MLTVFVSTMSAEILPPHFEYDDVSDKVLIRTRRVWENIQGKKRL